MFARLAYSHYLDWRRVYAVDPWGEVRQDLRAGIIASAVLAPHMKKGRRPPAPHEFVMKFVGHKERKQQTQKVMQSEFQSAMRAGMFGPVKTTKPENGEAG